MWWLFFTSAAVSDLCFVFWFINCFPFWKDHHVKVKKVQELDQNTSDVCVCLTLTYLHRKFLGLLGGSEWDRLTDMIQPGETTCTRFPPIWENSLKDFWISIVLTSKSSYQFLTFHSWVLRSFPYRHSARFHFFCNRRLQSWNFIRMNSWNSRQRQTLGSISLLHYGHLLSVWALALGY